ncbi:MAG: septum formation initiator family protein [Bacteroidales bacterium]
MYITKEKFIEFIKNRYFYTFFAFIIWLGFVDHNSLIDRVKKNNENERLNEVRQSYIQNIHETEEQMKAMEEEEYLEKLAREKYMMKKHNEDIFIVTE